jgi:hypothetical protein
LNEKFRKRKNFVGEKEWREMNKSIKKRRKQEIRKLCFSEIENLFGCSIFDVFTKFLLFVSSLRSFSFRFLFLFPDSIFVLSLCFVFMP